MSRVGNNPITIPSGVDIKIDNGMVTVKGPKGELTQHIEDCVEAKLEEGSLSFSRVSEAKDHKAKHGLYRALVNNMVVGVTEGYKTEQELVGVGYKAEASGQLLELNVGYSHSIFLQIPDEVSVATESVKGKPPKITLESVDKQLIGQIAAKIRSFRKPEPFKGKGIKFVGEQLRRKAGKSAAK